MKIKTKIFGEIVISEDKIIFFENGIIGFPELKRFTTRKRAPMRESVSCSLWMSRRSQCR